MPSIDCYVTIMNEFKIYCEVFTFVIRWIGSCFGLNVVNAYSIRLYVILCNPYIKYSLHYVYNGLNEYRITLLIIM
jgi:hypothetical protein